MNRRNKIYLAAAAVLAVGVLSAGAPGMEAQATSLDDGTLSVGIASTFDQTSSSEEEVEAAAEVLWEGTALEGYVNLGIADVDDNLNIRDEASESGSLVGKLRSNAACEILSYEGDWAYIESGDVTGYVKAEYLVTVDEAVELALELGQTVAKVTGDALYVRETPSTDAGILTIVPNGEELAVVEELDGWVEVDIDGETGYVCADYVEVSNELDTALTITEALYGEGITDIRASVCEYAKQFIGNRYVYGGSSLTNGTDCSGFTMSVMAHFGVSLPHSSSAQANCGTRVSLSEVKAGDLIFYGSGSRISHVALYIGNGQVVHASTSRTGIIISNMYYRTPICATRVLSD